MLAIPVRIGQWEAVVIAGRSASGGRCRAALDGWLAGATAGPQARPVCGSPLTGAVPQG